jgi:hypothetical protein
MICALELALLAMGLYALFRGKVEFPGSWKIEGVAARVAGFFLVLPIPIAFGVGLLIAVRAAETGQTVDDLRLTFLLVELITIAACVLLAVFAAIVLQSSGPSYHSSTSVLDEAVRHAEGYRDEGPRR